jgi:hypothetical protein
MERICFCRFGEHHLSVVMTSPKDISKQVEGLTTNVTEIGLRARK